MTRRQSTGRDFAMLAGGITAGIIGSRLLPPFIAALTGRVRTSKDPFDILIEDHKQLLSILDRMAVAPADSTMQRSRLFLMLKRKLAKHALAEEDVVYPLLHSQSEQAAQSKHLYDDHADLKILLFQLEDLVKSGQDWSEPVRSFRDLIRRHIDEEEQQVFPRLRALLGEDRLPKVSGQIRREEALIL
jgi:hemerythrin-like domain-containing protein